MNRSNTDAYLFGVEGMVRESPLEDNETIENIMKIERRFLSMIRHIDCYLRDKRDCPFARGNWVIDIHLKDGKIFCIKLPAETTRERINKYIRPLNEALKK